MKAFKFLLFVSAFALSRFSYAVDLDFKVDEEMTISIDSNVTLRESDTGILSADLGSAKLDVKFVFDEVPLEKRLGLAKQNDPESLIMLAWRYFLGVSVKKDLDKALEYCQKLQVLGGHDLNMLSTNIKGEILTREVLKNGKEKAIVAAQSGDANAALVLANSYAFGKNGFEKNIDEAKVFLEIACGLGNAQACFHYSDILLGEGDREKSMLYLKKAAADKTCLMARAALAFGKIKESQDKKEKEALLEELKSVADGGLDLAGLFVGRFYVEGADFEKNEKLGLEYLEKAARQGEDNCIMYLINYYESRSMRGKAMALARRSYAFDCKPAVNYVCTTLLSEKINKAIAEKNLAKEKLKERADAGDLSAMAELAKISTVYESLKLYKKIAAANADSFALKRVFEIWADKFNPEEDLADFEKFYEMALDKKIFLACFVKANLIGRGVIKSSNETPLELYKFGCENGSGECAYEMFRALKKEAKTKEEILKAVEYLKIASSKGVPSALADYGYLLLEGEGGVEKNEERGVELLKRAADAGNRSAAETLGDYYYSKNDKSECKKYLQKAGLLGSKKAVRNLGYVYAGEKDYKSAFRQLNSAMDLGDFSVAEDLAQMYKEGLGVEASEEMALVMLFIGSRKGDAECLRKYAYMLLSSEDPKIKDVENGLKILRFLFPIYKKRMGDIACALVNELTEKDGHSCEVYAYAKVAKNKGVDSKYISSCVEYFENKVINDENKAEFEKRVKELESEFTNEAKTVKFDLPIVPAVAEYFQKNSPKKPAENSEPAK